MADPKLPDVTVYAEIDGELLAVETEVTYDHERGCAVARFTPPLTIKTSDRLEMTWSETYG